MDVSNFFGQRIGIIGSTLLTRKCVDVLDKYFSIAIVIGLKEESAIKKVNYISLLELCNERNWFHDTSENWDAVKQKCEELDINLLFSIGDSRIVPESITSQFYVIGNHGGIIQKVKGGATLVWGRMINSGEWGIGWMRLSKRVDEGEILISKSFKYTKSLSMLEFVNLSDDVATGALKELLEKIPNPIPNPKTVVKVMKNTDSYTALKILEFCLKSNLTVYMPSRNLKDGVINKRWSKSFQKTFKIAQAHPYPRWSETE